MGLVCAPCPVPCAPGDRYVPCPQATIPGILCGPVTCDPRPQATIPGILCGPVTADLVTASQGRWFPVFALAAAVNWVGAIVYYSQSSALQVGTRPRERVR